MEGTEEGVEHRVYAGFCKCNLCESWLRFASFRWAVCPFCYSPWTKGSNLVYFHPHHVIHVRR